MINRGNGEDFMRISSKGKYAIEAMIYMAHLSNGFPVPLKVIAEKVGTTENYLEQIFFKLRKADLLDTVRGAKGGYFIKYPLEHISVACILQGVEEDTTLVPCMKRDNECTCSVNNICTTKTLWKEVHYKVEEVISHTTLLELLKGYCQMLQETYGELEYYL